MCNGITDASRRLIVLHRPDGHEWATPIYRIVGADHAATENAPGGTGSWVHLAAVGDISASRVRVQESPVYIALAVASLLNHETQPRLVSAPTPPPPPA